MALHTSEAQPPAPPGAHGSLSIAIAGSGGSGVMTAGTLLLDAAARAGLYGLMVRTSGPQIRGGEAAALLRLSTRPMQSLDDSFDLLLAIDWQNVNRFADEIPLTAESLLIGDADEGEPPEVFRATGARVVTLPLKKTAKSHAGSWINMLALGLAGAWSGVPAQALEAALRASWKRGAEALNANLAALRAGVAAAATLRAPDAAGHARRGTRRPLADQRQRSRRLRCHSRRRALRRRLSDHAGHRDARVDGARAHQGGRLAAAGRRRAGVGEHDHRRVVRRRAVAHRHRGPGPGADDRGHRPGGECRGADRRGRRDARRAFHRHPGQERAKRSVVCGQRVARRRAAPGAGADLDRRLPGHHAMGRAAGRGPAGTRDRAVGPVHGPVTRHHRPAGRQRRRCVALDRGSAHARLQALSRHRHRHLTDGGAGHAGHRVHRRWPGAQRGAACPAARRATTACNSTNASAS